MKILNSFRNLFSRRTPAKTEDWAKKLNNLGFDKINFPIIIKYRNNLDIVYRFDDFAMDPDLYFHEFESKDELIDCNGNLWTWKYDRINKVNIPSFLKRTMTLEEVKRIIDTHFQDSIKRKEIKSISERVTTINELLEQLADYF